MKNLKTTSMVLALRRTSHLSQQLVWYLHSDEQVITRRPLLLIVDKFQ